MLQASTTLGEDKALIAREDRDEWLRRAAALAEEGLRVLALAEATIPIDAVPAYESLNFLGLVGFRDPPRIDVKEAIADCRRAGIRVVMVTGDHAVDRANHRRDARARRARSSILVEGRELEALAALGERERERVLAAQVFARVTPAAEARPRAGSINQRARSWP